MTASQIGYEPVRAWSKRLLGAAHTTAVATVAWAVLCLLAAQRATPAALARALPAEQAGTGRSCLRWWAGPPLDQAAVSAGLVRQALAMLAAGQPVVVALDTTRLGGWEVWLAGWSSPAARCPSAGPSSPTPGPRGVSGPPP
jgi:hypothetical protein